jgi:pimeloyl-ACP methyl ester carboxylesterase
MSEASGGPFAELRNRHGDRLDFAFHEGAANPAGPRGGAADADSRSGAAGRPVAILAHGVTSHMDRPWLVELGDALARAGIPALRFSFAGNGRSEGRFEEATLTKEIDDATSVVDALVKAGFTRIAFAGHSMGGAIGLLLAARDERVRALVSLAGMFHVARFFERHFGGLRFGEPMLGKTDCPWNRALADDATRIGSLDAAARRVRVPWLLVHGSADEMVPLADAKDAVEAFLSGCARLPVDEGARLVANVQRIELAGADHRFTGAIPQTVSAVVPWLVAKLRD